MNAIMIDLYNAFIGFADNIKGFNDSLIWKGSTCISNAMGD